MKIGLLALSGIRAHDPELLELGLTLPGFVERSKQVAALPSLGLLYLAAVTPEGHDVSYFEAPSDGDKKILTVKDQARRARPARDSLPRSRAARLSGSRRRRR